MRQVVNLQTGEITFEDDAPPSPQQPITQEQINNEARVYLASTDWYVVRFAETGVAIPQDIFDARQAARNSVV